VNSPSGTAATATTRGEAARRILAGTRSWPLWAAAGAATAAVAVAWITRLAHLPPPPPFELDHRLGLFVGIAALCVMGLMLRRSPSVAWLAAAVAAAVVTADMVELGLDVRGPSDVSTSVAVAAALCFTLAVAVAISIGYAGARVRRLHPAVTWLGAVMLAWVVVAGPVSVSSIARDTVAIDRKAPVHWAITLPIRWWNYLALGFIGLGVLGDVVAADRRVRQREAGRPRGASRREALTERGAAVIDELVPGRTAVRDAAIEAERSRLAAELHADVLPAVRRALDAAEGGGSVERLASDLRGVLADVEGMLAQRRSIVLEELGLLPALEWLAERIEDRTDTRVLIEVADGAPNVRPPRSVERVAFRIATLALDNAVRHAPGTAVRIDLVTRPDRVVLEIVDGGPGIGAGRERTAIAAGRRGLADMRDEAASVGGSALIGSLADGGTRVAFSWPADG
jgi:signal transduction histidine kinase